MTDKNSQLESFHDYLAFERRLSSNTCQAYLRDLRCFAEFVDEANLGDWSEVTVHQMRRFVGQLSRRQYSPKSTQRMLSSVRAFYNFLLRRKQVTSNPAEGLPGPKAPKRLPSVLGVDEMKALLQVSADDPLSIRDLAIMELFYSSGLRLSELAGLTLERLDMDKGMVRVLGKGNKERVLPLGSYALAALQRWFEMRGQWVEENEQAVFVSKHGKQISVRTIQQRMAHWGLKQGVNGRVHPHRFRHSFASHVLESSGDIRAVQELLGHANLSTTQVYTHLDFQHLAQVYDQAHPRARKTKDRSE